MLQHKSLILLYSPGKPGEFIVKDWLYTSYTLLKTYYAKGGPIYFFKTDKYTTYRGEIYSEWNQARIYKF